jgi:hypothetical protein
LSPGALGAFLPGQAAESTASTTTAVARIKGRLREELVVRVG